jgi:hypothetical protein
MRVLTTATARAPATAAAALAYSGCGNVEGGRNDVGPPDASSDASEGVEIKPDTRAMVSGSCVSSISAATDGGATFTAEFEVNTGNVTVAERGIASWPQVGFAPLTVKKSSTLDTKHTSTIIVRRPATMEQTMRLQSWQEHYDHESGCAFTGKILSTVGQSH